jgi:PHD/YefM family antitoxin component YafN of YafNO toxin-antitoxin module
MPITLKSTEAQQNFGAMLDMALGENDVIVERYGTPRIAIVAYHRYQELLDAKRELMRLRLQEAAAAAAARAADVSDEDIDRLIEEARAEAQAAPDC